MNKDLEKALENMNRNTEELRISNVRYKQANERFRSWLDGERGARSSDSIPPPPMKFRVLGNNK